MMRMKTAIAFLAIFWGTSAARAEVTFDWATVGNPGNRPDQPYFQWQWGAVAYTYRISKYEVTNDQYAEFLNAVDPMGTNPNSVYNSSMGLEPRGGITFDSGAASGGKYSTITNMGNKPVNFVSFFDCMRFVNWLENGQPSGGSGTESGVYTIGDGWTEQRAVGATYFIPSGDEWHKAAFHQPASQGGDIDDFWLYPTASNSLPIRATANSFGDVGNPGANVVNYDLGASWNGYRGHLTSVGSAGPLSASFYGTFDQAGNVAEWNEYSSPRLRGVWGGGWSQDYYFVHANGPYVDNPENENRHTGFRVASIPEPSAGLLGTLGMLGLMQQRRRSS